MADDDGDGQDTASEDPDILVIAREEAHRVVDSQIQTLNDIDAKAARILRLNLVLIGILLTGLSIARPDSASSPTLIAFSDLSNVYNFAGIVFLLLSTGFAALTYTSSSLQSGVAASGLRDMVENDYSDRENLEGVITSYAKYIEYNRRVNAKNAPLGTLTLIFLVFGIVSVSLGVKKAATEQVEPWLLVLVGAFLLFFLYLTGIVGQLRRVYRISRLSTQVEGARSWLGGLLGR